MEQEPNLVAAIVAWVAEQIAGVALGSVIGAFGVRWWFGKKNQEKLDQHQQRISDLERELNGRPRWEPTAAASPESATESPPPQSRQDHVTIEFPTLPRPRPRPC